MTAEHDEPCDRAARDETAALLTPLAAHIDGAVHAQAQALERADRCIARRARDLPGLRAFLAKY